ncbi:hypothetical protein VQZ45_001380 [Salmonella enterica]|nr:hypothetical protein [Salmonella enterica]EEI9211054.1 hypothetical protein [Salmonella enterica subsp. enterica serovar Carrau]EEJ7416173.1 hypothetical protein [Salmonella enterica subsp. enterica serovar Sandiego]HCM4642005.1 hypothetical protein [Salmonella enterica subsp. enterica serovar Panama]EDI6980815.1 hypothetical protein [Salmonella enterica]
MTIDDAGLLAVLHDIARTSDTPARNVFTDYAGVVASVLQHEGYDLNGLNHTYQGGGDTGSPSTPSAEGKYRPLPVEETIAPARRVKMEKASKQSGSGWGGKRTGAGAHYRP